MGLWQRHIWAVLCTVNYLSHLNFASEEEENAELGFASGGAGLVSVTSSEMHRTIGRVKWTEARVSHKTTAVTCEGENLGGRAHRKLSAFLFENA